MTDVPRLARVERGAGEPVILLHSGGMSGRQWRRLIDELAPIGRVIAPDLLGCGGNPRWPKDAPFDFHQDVAAVAAIVAEVGPAHLIGHSYGGLIALTLAMAQPAQVRSLALYDPVAFAILHATDDREGLDDLVAFAHDPAMTDPATGGDEAWLTAFIDYWSGPGAFRGLPEPARQAYLDVGRIVFLEVASLMQDRAPREAFAALTMPTLLLSGSRTTAAARRTIAQLGATLPRSHTVILDGATHMGPWTHGAPFAAAVIAHLGQGNELHHG
jgi:pimeloyl-ACP methyl ester carboxylesterase